MYFSVCFVDYMYHDTFGKILNFESLTFTCDDAWELLVAPQYVMGTLLSYTYISPGVLSPVNIEHPTSKSVSLLGN